MPSFKHRSFVESGGRALRGSEAVGMGGMSTGSSRSTPQAQCLTADGLFHRKGLHTCLEKKVLAFPVLTGARQLHREQICQGSSSVTGLCQPGPDHPRCHHRPLWEVSAFLEQLRHRYVLYFGII